MRPPFAASLVLGLTLLAGLSRAGEPPAIRAPASPGVGHFRYQVIETVNGAPQSGYRQDLDLVTGRGGSVDARVWSAEATSDGKTWTPVLPPAACKAAMRAPKGGLAQVRLWPTSPDSNKALGVGFLDICAPPAVFFPLTDLLNVVVIPNAPTFNVAALKKPGDRAAYPGFTGGFDRGDQQMTEVSHGGEVSFVSSEGGRVVIDWAPAPADLDLRQPGPQGQPVTLKGVEHFAFRLEIDARTGALLRAATTYDDLDLAMSLPGVPADRAPRLKISRVVTIEPR